jgi:beta-lactamase regulating signal transducer with metallopeptidase domain
MSWLHYLLEANIYLGVFYMLYFILLNKETYYKLNRAYLLCTPVLSYIIPLIQIGSLKSYEDGGQVVATVIYNPALHQNTQTTATYFTLQNVLIYGYIAGATIMLILFILKISQLLKLTRTQKSLLNNKYQLVKVDDTNTAFSFFNYVFIGENVLGSDTMIRHELVHIDQKHSHDIVFLELIKIINWFNPFVYLLQRSLKTVHEYIADEHTAAYENDVLTYSSFLVSNAYGLSGSSISNSFFNYNLLKKRIIMLNQKRSGNLARLKYLLVIPVCGGLLCMSTLAFSKSYGWITVLPAKKSSVLELPVTKNGDTIVRLKVATGKKIPPPAPPRKAKAIDTIKIMNVNLSEPSKPVSANNAKLNKAVKVTNIKLIPPPPPPVDPLDSFYRYVAKHIRYPKSARDGLIAGKVILQFDVTNGKINNLKVTRGLSADLEGEARRVLSTYPGAMPVSAGTYSLPIGFQIWDKNNKMVAGQGMDKNNTTGKVADSNPASNTSTPAVYMLNEVIVTSYVN